MFQEFPYTDMHQLNLDWIVKIAKDFLDQYTHIQELIANGEQSIQDLTADGLAQLQNKATEIETLLNTWYDTHSADIANQLASALSDMDTKLTQTLAEFATRAEQKAEETLADIPADYTQLSDEITYFKNGIMEEHKPAAYKEGYLNTSGAIVSSATDWRVSPYYPIIGNIIGIKGHVNSLSGIGYNVCFYDANRTFIAGKLIDNTIADDAIEIVPPNGAALFRFSNALSIFSNNKIYFVYDRLDSIVTQNIYRKRMVNLKYAGYINNSGELIGTDPWRTSDYIYVHNMYIGLIGVLYGLGANGCNISLYDQDKKFISGYPVYNYDVDFSGFRIDVKGAYFIRISTNKDYFPELFVVYSYNGCYKNMIDRSDILTNYYVDYTSGNVYANSGYGVTPYIPITPGGVYRYTVKLDIGNEYAIQQCAFYDENMKYVSGMSNAGETGSKTILAPDNAYYLRWTIKLNYQKIQLEPGITETEYEMYWPYDVDPLPCHVGSTREITSVLQALKELPACVPVILDGETFDIVSEYTAYYGANYWTNYAGYQTSDPFDRGLWLANGRKLSGNGRTIIRCWHDDSNHNITIYFSVFANAENVTLENIIIEMNYVRYAIHDDFSGSIGNSTNNFKNIVFNGHSTGQIIGGGLGYNNIYNIENCVFKINESTWDIHYHNSTSGRSDNVNRIYIRNCRGYRDCGIQAYGSAQTLSSMIVSACKFRDIKAYRPDDTTIAPYMNVELIEWCNETP